MKKVLVINANPKRASLCKSLAEEYVAAATGKHEVQQIDIRDLNFELSLNDGYDKTVALEPDLVDFQSKIKWAEHIVIVSPVWWGTVPAKLKGAIDRAFLPGFAFQYVEGQSMPKKLLDGRTSELIITLDSPPIWYKYVKGNVIYKHLKHSILDFSGIKNISSIYLGPVIHSTSNSKRAWFNKVAKSANKLK